MSTRNRIGMSWWNVVCVLAIAVASVISFALERWFTGTVLGAVLVLFVASILYARSGRASDVTRLNAAEYTDERDRRMAAFGLAIVGVVAMVASVGTFAAAMALLPADHPMALIAWAQLVGLAVTWCVGNWIATRRH